MIFQLSMRMIELGPLVPKFHLGTDELKNLTILQWIDFKR